MADIYKNSMMSKKHYCIPVATFKDDHLFLVYKKVNQA